MPRGTQILGQPIDENKWEKAKKRASEEGHENDYDYIMGIYKKMMHLGEFNEKHIYDRKKKKQNLPEWKKNNWDSKKRKLKEVSKSSNRFHLVLGKSIELEEFRCGNCNALIFKGLNLEKSLIEVKCRSCGVMLVSGDTDVIQY